MRMSKASTDIGRRSNSGNTSGKQGIYLWNLPSTDSYGNYNTKTEKSYEWYKLT